MNDFNKDKKKSSRRERVGFYLALAICVTAVGLAVWSTYTTYDDLTAQTKESEYLSSLSSIAANNEVSGVTQAESTYTTSTTAATTTAETTTQPTSAEETTESMGAVETMLKVEKNLDYPFADVNIAKEFTNEAVYNATMLDYRPHTGVDFTAKKGTTVLAMCDGTITDIREDEMYGYIITQDCGTFEIYYCGMSKNTDLKNTDTVEKGDKIGIVGEIPCEVEDGEHIHVSVKVKDASYIDPLSVISSDE